VSLLLCFALLLLLLAPAPAAAVDPARHISQYGHNAWRIQDGFFDGAPYSIAQNADGYLWIGGANGLVRFDGVRFVPLTPPPGEQLLSPVVARALAARDGSLWIGTTRGLSHWTNQNLINYSTYANAVTAPFVEEENGTIWVLRAGIADGTGPLCQINGRAVRCYGKADGIPEEPYSSLARDSAGNFWLGGSTSLTRWRPDSFQTYYVSGLKSNTGQPGVCAVAPGHDGSLWVGICQHGPGLGLQQFSQGVWKPFVVPGFDSSTLRVLTLFVDGQNALWVGTVGQGVYRIYGSEVDHFGRSEGLSGDAIYAFFEDREGNLWVATDKGLDCFRDLQITTFSTREGLTTPAVGSVQATRDGAIWMAGVNGLDILGPGLGQSRVRSFQTGKGLPGAQVTSLFEDRAGQHWVGIDNTLNIYENGRFTRVARRDGSPTGMILGITEDVNNNLWVLSYGPPTMLIRIVDRKVQEELPTPQIPAASSLVADARGGVWLGLLDGDLARYQQGRVETFRFEHPPNSRVNQVLLSSDGWVLGATTFGLIGWSNGKQQTLSARNGLPCDRVNGLVEDGSGALWLYMQCGLVEIPRSDLQRWWAQPNVSLQPKEFDVFDGFQSGNRAPFESKAVRTLDGRLWFANAAVAQMIDPSHLARNLIAPAVHVEQVIADRKGHSLQGDVRLPARTRDVEIDYTALSLAVPQKVRFRYKLEGRDTDWQEAGTRRQAFYTDLGPGTYRFHVIACNNDGIWNQQGASLDFKVMPAWYQTIWFKLLFVVIILTTTWALHRLRVRQVARALAVRFDERLAERTRIARELHDTFLQTVQGSKLVANDALESAYEPARMRQAMEQLSTWLGRAVEEGRAALNSLRTSTTETNDLAEGLRRATEECRLFSPMETSFSVEGDSKEMHPVVRDEIYRIGYEAIRNASAHSKASRLYVGLKYGQDIAVSVGDNGVGIPESIIDGGTNGHYGLQGMRERAARVGGKLRIVSSVDSGTEVSLVVPGSIAFR
jgi:signal transduction histidine kinase/ligand-binding sensor domain-containing protein